MRTGWCRSGSRIRGSSWSRSRIAARRAGAATGNERAINHPGVTHMVTADPLVFERYMTKATSFFRKHLGAAK